MKKKNLLFICAIITFILGVCAVIVWFNFASVNHFLAINPFINLDERCSKTKNFPGLSKEITKLEKGKSGYFPKNTFARDNWEDADDVTNNWYGEHLEVAEEKSLLDISNKDLEIYRFTWLRTSHHPVIVRIEKSEDKVEIIFKELDGKGADEPGSLIKEKNISLNEKDWCKFVELLNNADYWKMKTDGNDPAHDTSQWILEGVKDNRYHVVDRTSPEKGKYRKIGLFLLKLSDFDFDNGENSLY